MAVHFRGIFVVHAGVDDRNELFAQVLARRRWPAVERRVRRRLERDVQNEQDGNKLSAAKRRLEECWMPGDDDLAKSFAKVLRDGKYGQQIPENPFIVIQGRQGENGKRFQLYPVVVKQLNALRKKSAATAPKARTVQVSTKNEKEDQGRMPQQRHGTSWNASPQWSTYSTLFALAIPVPDNMDAFTPDISAAKQSFLLPCISGAAQYLNDFQCNLIRSENGLFHPKKAEWYFSRSAPLGTPLESNEVVLRTIQQRSGFERFAEAPGVRHPSWKPFPAREKTLDGFDPESNFPENSNFFSLDMSCKKIVTENARQGKAETIVWGPQPTMFQRDMQRTGSNQLSFHLSERVCATVCADGSLCSQSGWKITGVLQCVSKIEGHALVSVSLHGLDHIIDQNNDRPEDEQIAVQFFYHECVRASSCAGPVPSGGRVVFCPPLGHFNLLQYTISMSSSARMGDYEGGLQKRRESLIDYAGGTMLNQSLESERSSRTLESDAASTSSILSSATSRLSLEDRGKYQARVFRRSFHLNNPPTQTKQRSQLPHLPVTGAFHVKQGKNNETLDVAIGISIGDLSAKRLLPMVQLILPENVVIKSHSLVADGGRVVLEQNRKSITWVLHKDNIGDNSDLSLTGQIQVQVQSTCNPFPNDVEYIDRAVAAPFSTPFRKSNPAAVYLHFSTDDWSCSGLTLEPVVEVTPPDSLKGSVSTSSTSTSERVTLRRFNSTEF